MVRKGSVPEDFGRWAKETIVNTENSLDGAVKVALSEGVNVMRGNIMTRGVPPKSARYDTGLMFDSVEYKMLSSLPSRVSGEFGWTDEQRKYFVYQEKGFQHYLSGKKIPAMNALRDAFSYAVNVLDKEIKRVFKK